MPFSPTHPWDCKRVSSVSFCVSEIELHSLSYIRKGKVTGKGFSIEKFRWATSGPDGYMAQEYRWFFATVVFVGFMGVRVSDAATGYRSWELYPSRFRRLSVPLPEADNLRIRSALLQRIQEESQPYRGMSMNSLCTLLIQSVPPTQSFLKKVMYQRSAKVKQTEAFNFLPLMGEARYVR